MLRTLVVAFAALLVAAAPAGAAVHNSTDPIVIPDSGPANPYPATMPGGVFGEPGLILDVNVTLLGFSHSAPDDLDIVLVSPSGTSVVLMSDACGTTLVDNRTWMFNDAAPAGDVPDGGPCDGDRIYRPENHNTSPDTWPPATNTPAGDDLSLFNGENPNGTWRLFIRDDATGDPGQVAGGWRLTLSVGTSKIQLPGGANSAGVASPYPAVTSVSGKDGVLTDLNVLLDGMTHAHPDDLDLLLEGPRGQKVILMSESCGGVGEDQALDDDWLLDDEAPTDLLVDADCPAGSYRPTTHPPGATFPAPAPGGPYGAALSDFDLTDANGDWKLWAVDQDTPDAGFLIGGYELQMQTRPGAAVDFLDDFGAFEGSSVKLLVTRGGPPPLGEGTVRVRTADGTAVAGADYTAIDRTITFPPNVASAEVEVPVAADRPTGEGIETFTATLSDPGGDAALGSAKQTTTVQIGPPDPIPFPPQPPPPPVAFTSATAGTLSSNRRCKPRGAQIRFRAKSPPVVRTELFVNGRRVANRLGPKADDLIRVRVRRRLTRILVRVHAADGRIVRYKRTFRRCAPRRRG